MFIKNRTFEENTDIESILNSILLNQIDILIEKHINKPKDIEEVTHE